MAVDEGIAPAAGTSDPGTVHRLKPNAVGLLGVVFMAVATAAPITAMTGNVPFMVSSGNGIGAPASYLVAMVVLAIFSVGFTSMAKHITATGAFYGFISHGLGRSAGLASGLLATFAYVVFEPALIGIFSTFATTTLKASMGVAAGPESDSPVLKATPWIVGLIAVAGFGYAQYLKRRSPERYALLGRTVLEETKER